MTLKEQSSKEQLLKVQLLKENLYEKQTGNKWDRRSKLEIYEDLKKTNNEVSILVAPIIYIHENYSIFPLSGISNSQTINCNENGYYSIYQSDRYGFNNPNTEWDEKEIEYFIVGDSFTHDCVNRPYTIGSILRNLSNKSVLDLGLGGNGPLIEYAILREYLDTDVKKVVWFFFEGNDLYELKTEKKSNILLNYLNDLNFTQNLKSKQNEIDNLGKTIISKERKQVIKIEKNIKFKLLRFIKLYITRQLILPAPAITVAPEFKKILKLTKELVEKNNSKLYFVYLPDYSRYKMNYSNLNHSYVKSIGDQFNIIKDIVNELNISFIDIHKEVFEKEQNPTKLFPFQQYGHYNIEGHKKVAEAIYKLTKD